ncbi:hypothetical protein [Eilatimonas milleporae]|uniref:Uncharacterized protein n=1 Tax=Eilatimonas milleporae TaxID=911205 RepID=A0A3M0CNW8_9PROT|nr:hypothetical protein [Eilatimonas milleporae]RMB04973.1 hypothetical protein BXY39_2547 [Eilatimonas milleporae]
MTSDADNTLSKAAEAVTLHKAYEPALAGGHYRLALQQSVQFIHKGSPEAYHYYHDQPFIVQGPRFFLAEEDVHASFPPNGAVGEFESILPYVVFRKRSLPWDRSIWFENVPRPCPWLALLILSRQEYEEAGGDQSLSEIKLQELIQADQNGAHAASPELAITSDENADDDALIRVFEMPADMFMAVAPRPTEIPLLAHVRMVGHDRKADLGMHAEGAFSIITSNRTPSPGSNIGLLVSLEGWESLLQRKRTIEVGRIQIVVLHLWHFENDRRRDFSFSRLAADLNVGTFGAGMPGTETPTEGGETGPPLDEWSKAMIRAGFVPMDYARQDSSPTVAWYRGPLTPGGTSVLPHDCFNSSDAALMIESETGMAILSYAAAWEMGRLLALSAPSYVDAVRRFIQEGAGRADGVDPAATAQRLERFWQTYRDALRAAGEQPEQKAAYDPLLLAKIEDGSGFWRIDAVIGITRWLAELLLLDRVPFHYLVIIENLLPKESIRFFEIDNNWLVALGSGALSLSGAGADPSADSLQTNLSRVVERYLDWRDARTSTSIPKSTFLEEIKTGFVLRSALVSGWPGLEIEITTTDNKVKKPLKIERIGEGVLFCIVLGDIQSVSLLQPPEGIVQWAPEQMKYRTDQVRHGVLDIEAYAGQHGDQGRFDSSSLASKMMASGASQTIRWTRDDGL